MTANELLGVDEHDRILMSPKLLAKSRAMSANGMSKSSESGPFSSPWR
jgi:hypothetical protein